MTQPNAHMMISNTICRVPPLPQFNNLALFLPLHHLHYSLRQLSSPLSPAMLSHPCTRSKHNVGSRLQIASSHNITVIFFVYNHIAATIDRSI